MNIAQTIQNSVEAMPVGQIFGYQELPNYTKSPSAVIKAISRMVSEKRLERLSKGKFYVPKKGVLGLRKPSDAELVRSVLYKNGRVCGYVTGLSLYNQLGLTTQMPRTITVACNGGRQEKNSARFALKR
jgi:predicted transcriptional regulator of viral defense system